MLDSFRSQEPRFAAQDSAILWRETKFFRKIPDWRFRYSNALVLGLDCAGWGGCNERRIRKLAALVVTARPPVEKDSRVLTRLQCVALVQARHYSREASISLMGLVRAWRVKRLSGLLPQVTCLQQLPAPRSSYRENSG